MKVSQAVTQKYLFPPVVNKDYGEFCLGDDLEDPTIDFCDSNMVSRYLRVYVSDPQRQTL